METKKTWMINVWLLLGLFARFKCAPDGCRGRLDIAFIIDNSESILEYDPPGKPLHAWNLLRSFATRVTQSLPTDTETRVAAIKFASTARVQFYLDQYTTSERAQKALMRMHHEGGNTNTAQALWLARNDVFLKEKGDRADARNVIVLITDGLSNVLADDAEPEAERIKDADVEIFTLGITDYINVGHLQRIASPPHSTHFIHALDFEQLDSVLDLLVHRICGMPDPPIKCIPECIECLDTRTCVKCENGKFFDGRKCTECVPNCETCRDTLTCDTCNPGYYWEVMQQRCLGCDIHADIVFVVDNSGSIRDKNPKNYGFLKKFIKNLVSRMNVDTGAVRIGAVRFSGTAKLVFHLDQYTTLMDVHAAIDDAEFDGGDTNTYSGLNMMRTELFRSDHGDRPGVGNIAILITDGESTVNKNLTILEASLAKKEAIKMFVVGVTKQINDTELKLVASPPVNRHYFNSTEINQLNSLLLEITKHVCIDSSDAGSMPEAASQIAANLLNVDDNREFMQHTANTDLHQSNGCLSPGRCSTSYILILLYALCQVVIVNCSSWL